MIKKVIVFTGLVVATLIAGLFSLSPDKDQPTYAYMTGFDPGNIMSDFVMSNKNSMTVSQIQAFLNDKVPTCTTNTLRGYHNEARAVAPCLKDFKEDSRTASQIIWQAGQDYSINPQVLIVLLQKEQGLTTDTWPRDGWWWTKTNLGTAKMECTNSSGKPAYCVNAQYRSATGYGCPDTAPCDAQYFGFANQIRKAAELFRTVLDGGWTNYPVGNNYIQYSPDPTCGGSTVNIKNRATSALYRYTPYQPNAGAIANNPGTAPCGAYGNRNFYHFFTEWFGSTGYILNGAIGRYYNSNNGTSILGQPISNEKCGLANSGCRQEFQKGWIYWTSATGAWKISGGIGKYWIKHGADRNILGYPISNEQCGLVNDGCYQEFQKGHVYWTSTTGANRISGGIGNFWIKNGADNNILGYPTSNEQCGLANNGCHQEFQKGWIYWTSATGAQRISGGIGRHWIKHGADNNTLGYPISSEQCGLVNAGCVQEFQKGRIYWTSTTGAQRVSGGIDKRYLAINADNSFLGYPASGETVLASGGVYQQFENGRIYWKTKLGAWEIRGGIGKYWIKHGADNNTLGYPISSEQCGLANDGCYQQFQNGRIYWTSARGAWAV